MRTSIRASCRLEYAGPYLWREWLDGSPCRQPILKSSGLEAGYLLFISNETQQLKCHYWEDMFKSCIFFIALSFLVAIVGSTTTLVPSPTRTNSHASHLPSIDPQVPFRRVFPPYRLDNGWRVHVATFHFVLPQPSAAIALQYFYNNIINWTTTSRAPEIGFFRLRMGVFALEFECRQCTIPWYFVRAFAEMMLRQTQGGFAGAYQMFYDHVDSTRIVVALYIDL